jgi:hypothetical protein
MLPTSIVVALLATFFAAPALQAEDDACALLTPARVGKVLRVSVAAGQHMSETPNGRRVCTWSERGENPLMGKRVTVTLFGPVGQLTPADRFANSKKQPNVTPVAGIGDDPFVRRIGALATHIYVKRGEAVFQLTVGGFSENDTPIIEGALARDAVSKL